MSELELAKPEVIFPDHYGFCEGVVAADLLLKNVAREAREKGIPNIYGYHDVVHNQDVVAEHEANGVVFADDIEAIPAQTIVVTSAHGVGPEIVYGLEEKGCLVFDAACPLVLHAQRGAKLARENDEKVIYICQGKPGEVDKLHDEVQGMVGHLDFTLVDGRLVYDPLERAYLELDEALDATNLLGTSGKYRIVSQTTLDSDRTFSYRQAVKKQILATQPDAEVAWSKPGDVCRAVTLRQKGVNQLLQIQPERLVVVTDPSSKNGMGYVKLAAETVKRDQLETEVVAVANADEARSLGKIEGVTAVTASASTPDKTLFAVTKELGLQKKPEVVRKSFTLQDARGNRIRQRIDHFLQRAGATAVADTVIQ